MRATSDPRDLRCTAVGEQGSALVMCLVVICVVSVLGVAVLKLQQTSASTLRVGTTVGNNNIAVDSALDTTIAKIRSDANAGFAAGAWCKVNGELAYWDALNSIDVFCSPRAAYTNDRVVTLDARPHNSPVVLARAVVEFVDSDQFGTPSLGSAVKVISMIKQPGQ
jgi:hypothetical protein